MLTESPRVTVEDVDAAYVGARDTQPGWSQTTPGERSAIFLRAGWHAGRIGDLRSALESGSDVRAPTNVVLSEIDAVEAACRPSLTPDV